MKIRVGDTVAYRGSWGHGDKKRSAILAIEFCKDGGKYGEDVEEIDVGDIEKCVFDLADGHWCYGYQIEL